MKISFAVLVLASFLATTYSYPPYQAIRQSMYQLSMEMHSYFLEHNYQDNYVFSPFEIFGTLSMVFLGSAGDTFKEFAHFMFLDQYGFDKYDEIHEEYSRMIGDIRKSKYSNGTFVNGVFYKKEFSLLDSYHELISKYYNSDFTTLDFTYPDKALSVINQWISQKTYGKSDHFYDTVFDKETSSVFLSAFHFFSKWNNQFSEKDTAKMSYHLTDKHEIEMYGMVDSDTIPYIKDDSLQFEAIGLPYEHKEAYFYVVMPYEGQTWSNLSTYFTYDKIMKTFHEATESYVKYTIPKFKVSFFQDFVETFKYFGLKKAFDGQYADFSKLVAETGFHIDHFGHKTDFEVTEVGTYAGSASPVSFLSNKNYIEFVLNRPFMFHVYHVPSHSLLYQGYVYNPTY